MARCRTHEHAAPRGPAAEARQTRGLLPLRSGSNHLFRQTPRAPAWSASSGRPGVAGALGREHGMPEAHVAVVLEQLSGIGIRCEPTSGRPLALRGVTLAGFCRNSWRIARAPVY